MTVPFRTFALLGLAVGMLAAGYVFGPATGASSPTPARPSGAAARTEPPPVTQAQAKSAPVVVSNRPPVPLVTQRRSTYFQQATVDRPVDPMSGTDRDKPTADMGTFAANPADPNDKTQALAAPPGSVDDSKARRAIEFDGYRNVRDLVQGPDGTWRGRALRGRTEIAVRVDASGNVSAE